MNLISKFRGRIVRRRDKLTELQTALLVGVTAGQYRCRSDVKRQTNSMHSMHYATNWLKASVKEEDPERRRSRQARLADTADTKAIYIRKV